MDNHETREQVIKVQRQVIRRDHRPRQVLHKALLHRETMAAVSAVAAVNEAAVAEEIPADNVNDKEKNGVV